LGPRHGRGAQGHHITMDRCWPTNPSPPVPPTTTTARCQSHVKQTPSSWGATSIPRDRGPSRHLLPVPPICQAGRGRDKNGKAGPVSVSHRSRFVVAQVSNTPWLTAWAPGHARMWSRRDGCGVPQRQPRGSSRSITTSSRVTLRYGPATLVPCRLDTSEPLHLNLLPLPDIPCPPGDRPPVQPGRPPGEHGPTIRQSGHHFRGLPRALLRRSVTDPRW